MKAIAILSQVAAVLALEGLVPRQNGPGPDNSNTQCPQVVQDLQNGKAYNATGTLSLRNPWYSPQWPTVSDGGWFLSMGLSWNDSNSTGNVDIFLSVPQGQLNFFGVESAHYCALVLAPLNQTSNGRARDLSCEHIISPDCRGAVRAASSRVDGRCQFSEGALDEVEEACGGRPLRTSCE